MITKLIEKIKKCILKHTSREKNCYRSKPKVNGNTYFKLGSKFVQEEIQS